MYNITFVIRGIELKETLRKIEDDILLELDIVSSIPKYGVKYSGELFNFNYYEKISKRYIRISDLAEKGWIKIELNFFSNAKGIWEYRILPYQGYQDTYKMMKQKNPNARIVFDKVIVTKIPRLQIPTV